MAAPAGLAPIVRVARIAAALFREARAVYHGQRLHEGLDSLGEGRHFALRRNIHRLEKGLISRPRRDVFALEYIAETVDMFASEATQCGDGAGDDLRWARDVLDSYFEHVDDHPKVALVRDRFMAVRGIISESDRPLAPFQRDTDTQTLPTYDQLLSLARYRRSVRWFRPEPVPRDLIEKALAIAAQSPSACNRQPFQFRIFDEPDKVRQVSALAEGTKGFNHNFPAVAVVVGRLRAYSHEKDRHVIYIDGGLASMSFVLALETLGLGSCCINWADVRERNERMQRLLGLAPDERVIMLIAFGFPDAEGLVPFSGKRPLTQLASFNQLAK